MRLVHDITWLAHLCPAPMSVKSIAITVIFIIRTLDIRTSQRKDIASGNQALHSDCSGFSEHGQFVVRTNFLVTKVVVTKRDFTVLQYMVVQAAWRASAVKPHGVLAPVPLTT